LFTCLQDSEPDDLGLVAFFQSVLENNPWIRELSADFITNPLISSKFSGCTIDLFDFFRKTDPVRFFSCDQFISEFMVMFGAQSLNRDQKIREQHPMGEALVWPQGRNLTGPISEKNKCKS
jgi:hypothetical protein